MDSGYCRTARRWHRLGDGPCTRYAVRAIARYTRWVSNHRTRGPWPLNAHFCIRGRLQSVDSFRPGYAGTCIESLRKSDDRFCQNSGDWCTAMRHPTWIRQLQHAGQTQTTQAACCGTTWLRWGCRVINSRGPAPLSRQAGHDPQSCSQVYLPSQHPQSRRAYF